MTHQVTSDQPNTAALPDQATPREIVIYGHSTLFFWWPAWAIGFVFAVLNAGQEKFLATAPGSQPSSVLGLSYATDCAFKNLARIFSGRPLVLAPATSARSVRAAARLSSKFRTSSSSTAKSAQ